MLAPNPKILRVDAIELHSLGPHKTCDPVNLHEPILYASSYNKTYEWWEITICVYIYIYTHGTERPPRSAVEPLSI